MELLIIRHAKAALRDAERWPDDTQRPLTKEGAREFERTARALRGWRPEVDMVLSSGWPRAWETAEILRARARWPKPVRTKLLEASDSSAPARIVELLSEQPADARIALVGHEPILSQLIGALVSPGATVRLEMRKGAVAWLRGAPGAMMLSGLLIPRMLLGD